MYKKILTLLLGTILLTATTATTAITIIQPPQLHATDTNDYQLLSLNVAVTITPYNPPIIIPHSGGNFTYNIEVINNEATNVTFDIWTMYTLPNGSSYGPLFGPAQFTLPTGWSSQNDLTQYIPTTMPTGNYSYIVHTGLYPNDIWDSDNFTFEKLSETSGWYQQNPNLGERLNAISFPDSEHGWGVSDSDTIIYTLNGGDTWFQQDDGLYYNEVYNDVYFVDDQTGWIGGSMLLNTTNGGMNWTIQHDPGSTSIYGLYFLDQHTGWAVGGRVDFYNYVFIRKIMHTSDGGATWTTQHLESGYNYIRPFYDIYFLDTTYGWAVGGNGAVFHTSNGGATWAQQTSDTNNDLFSIHFTDSNTGWAVGEDGTVLTTINGGTTWSAYSLGTTDILNSIQFTDPYNGWIAGGGYYPLHGTIFHTNDSGTTWHLQDTGTGDLEYILNDICFVNQNMGWAAGETFYPWQAVVLHTENGGGSHVDPILAYTPTSHDFGNMYNGGTASTNITIWNNGTGVLSYYFQPDCTWISVTPDQGFSAGEQDTLNLTIDALGLQPGSYQCNVTIYSNDGTSVIPVYVTILPSNQILAYDPIFYDFGDVWQNSLVTTNISVWNAGTGTLYYWFDDSYTFCVVDPWSGSSQGEINYHTLNCFTSTLPLGPNQCTITIHSNGGTGLLTVYVNVIPWGGYNDPPVYSNEQPLNNSLNIPITTTTLSLDIYDPNGDSFDWSIETSPSIGSNGGTAAANGTKTCSITGLAPDTTYIWYVNATDNGGSIWIRHIYSFTTEPVLNTAPEPPLITGPIEGPAGQPCSYTFMSTDENNDDISYYIDWGDGTQTNWTSYMTQGNPGYDENHSWPQGTYTIYAKAKDIHGQESEWTSLEITLPVNQPKRHNPNIQAI